MVIPNRRKNHSVGWVERVPMWWVSPFALA